MNPAGKNVMISATSNAGQQTPDKKTVDGVSPQKGIMMIGNNEHDNSLQLFDSASVGESHRDNENHDSRPSQNTLAMRGSNRVFKLNLDGIEDISDYDVDSIKNTSARAITFN